MGCLLIRQLTQCCSPPSEEHTNVPVFAKEIRLRHAANQSICHRPCEVLPSIFELHARVGKAAAELAALGAVRAAVLEILRSVLIPSGD